MRATRTSRFRWQALLATLPVLVPTKAAADDPSGACAQIRSNHPDELRRIVDAHCTVSTTFSSKDGRADGHCVRLTHNGRGAIALPLHLIRHSMTRKLATTVTLSFETKPLTQKDLKSRLQLEDPQRDVALLKSSAEGSDGLTITAQPKAIGRTVCMAAAGMMADVEVDQADPPPQALAPFVGNDPAAGIRWMVTLRGPADADGLSGVPILTHEAKLFGFMVLSSPYGTIATSVHPKASAWALPLVAYTPPHELALPTQLAKGYRYTAKVDPFQKSLSAAFQQCALYAALEEDIDDVVLAAFDYESLLLPTDAPPVDRALDLKNTLKSVSERLTALESSADACGTSQERGAARDLINLTLAAAATHRNLNILRQLMAAQLLGSFAQQIEDSTNTIRYSLSDPSSACVAIDDPRWLRLSDRDLLTPLQRRLVCRALSRGLLDLTSPPLSLPACVAQQAISLQKSDVDRSCDSSLDQTERWSRVWPTNPASWVDGSPTGSWVDQQRFHERIISEGFVTRHQALVYSGTINEPLAKAYLDALADLSPRASSLLATLEQTSFPSAKSLQPRIRAVSDSLGGISVGEKQIVFNSVQTATLDSALGVLASVTSAHVNADPKSAEMAPLFARYDGALSALDALMASAAAAMAGLSAPTR